MTSSENNLTDWLAAACEAARRGAAVLLKWRERFAVREKGRFDLVTDADLESQQVVREYLLGCFSDHGFLGEEDPESQQRPGPNDSPVWIVDPLDGTTNYVHDCPFYAVSIGLWHAGEMIVGIVHDPSRDEMFRAAKGHGAWLGERRLKVSDASELGASLLSVGFPPDIRKHEEALDWWEKMSREAQALRRTGSTALNLAYIAAGRFDGFWAFDNHVWDVAGGVVLINEAGGKVTNIDGSDYDPFTGDALASNGLLHPRLLDVFRGVL